MLLTRLTLATAVHHTLHQSLLYLPPQSCWSPAHTLLQWEDGTAVLVPAPRPGLEAPSAIYSQRAIWRDSKLQMLLYLRSLFFLLVLWVLFHP